ncbi:MAG: RlmE family RNA methyltransferase, partial [Pseudomonadota bacterium]
MRTKVRVKTSKGRKISSTRWLQRQLNDPYRKAALMQGLRARSAFKLLDIDQKFDLLGQAMNVLDLGAAPGSWLQILKLKCPAKAQIIGLDLLPVDDLPGIMLIEGDFLDPEMTTHLQTLTPGQFDLITCDMAANSTGHANT